MLRLCLSRSVCTMLVLVGCASVSSAVFGQTLVWSDEFDGTAIDHSTWTYNVGGSGFGNGELQYYTARPENIRIDNGNLVIEARRENYLGDKSFTSSRLISLGRFSFKYGTLEARIKLPNVDNGIWPAFWLLGTNIGERTWPACGEVDILEVGSKTALEEGVINRRVASHVFWDYEGNQADFGGHVDAAVDLYQDYHLFKMEWTPEHIVTYFDNVEFWSIDIDEVDENSLEEFHKPMYILANMAVGGWNFIEITDPNAITASFPARMYIDYIRLYDNGDTELYYGQDTAESGDFGVFTENTPVNNSLTFEEDAALYIWNNMQAGSDEPYEGEEVWSFTTGAGMWWGMGILAYPDRNMQDYSDGYLHFHMKTSATAPFKVGIKSTVSGESWVTFADGEASYGLERDGQWHEVLVPLNTFLNVDFATVNQIFMIAGDPSTSNFDFAIDNVYWSPSVARPTPENGSFGIYTEDPDHQTAGNYELGVDGEFFVWSETLQDGTQDPYEGESSLSFYSSPGLNWFGAAFTPTIKYNLTAFRFPESKLHLAMKTSSTATFRLGMRSGNVDDIGQKWIEFANGNDPYGFVRDGQWHIVEIPMADIMDAVDLSEVSMLFELLGVAGPISDIELDDICLIGGGQALAVGAGYPVADAGENQTLILPANSAILDGSASHDNGSIVSYLWEQVDGPSTATLINATNAVASARNLVEGTYRFRLTVTDDEELINTDMVSVLVTTPYPTADAGSDQSIALPQNSVTLAGSGSDADGTIVAYEWTQLSGPSTATLIGADTDTATATNLYEGTYVFELTVTDNDANTDSDQVTVEVTYVPANIALARPVVTSSAIGSSLIVNGGFEFGSGTDADSWTANVFHAGSSVAIVERSDENVYSGNWCLNMTVEGANDGGPAAEAMQQTPTGSVVPGATYDLEVQIKSIGSIGPGVVMQLAVQWLDTDGSHGGGVKGSTGFVNIQGSVATNYSTVGLADLVAADGSDAALVYLRLAGGAFDGSAAEIMVDDVALISGANIAEYAVDGNATTSWRSDYSDPQWLQVELDDKYEMSKVVINWGDPSSVAYSIEVSDDATQWNTAYTTTAGAGGIEVIDLYAAGRYVRIYSEQGSDADGCAVNELEVYGELQRGDIDGDGDIDLADFSVMVDCLAGPVTEVTPECVNADLNRDARVDLADYAKFQLAFDPE